MPVEFVTPAEEDAHAAGEPSGLSIGNLNKAEWDQPSRRRQGLRDLHHLHRYGMSFRSPRVVPLETCIDFRLHDAPLLRWYQTHPFFTGILVLQERKIVYEQYAADFGPDRIHSLQSISKTGAHLMVGRLVEAGALDLTQPITTYVPEVRAGYAGASVQDALDMAVINDYTEDFYDPSASVALLEDSHGWRLAHNGPHRDIRAFLSLISAGAGRDPHSKLHYKSANTDVVAWICERVARRSLREMLLEIVEAVGAADSIYVSTDRSGVPFVGGGLHMTLRDMGRYGLLLANGGVSLLGQTVGSRTFLDRTRSEHSQGTLSLLGHGRYRNFLETDGTWVGHNGYGGQWLMVYPEAEIVVACLSAIADAGGLDWGFIGRLADMGEELARILMRG